jgi:transposase
MIRTTLQVRIFVCTEPTDMRRSFDGLCGMTRELIRQDPLSGAFFLFRNRSRDRLKILYWDRDGLAIWCRKNDQAWIEQKNGSVIRRFVGYARYSGAVAGQTMANLYHNLRLYVNFFQPLFKLLSKHREGSKV